MRGPIAESGHRPNLISPGQVLLVDGNGWFISPIWSNLGTLEALTCRPLCNSPFPSVSRKTCWTFYICRIDTTWISNTKIRTSPLNQHDGCGFSEWSGVPAHTSSSGLENEVFCFWDGFSLMWLFFKLKIDFWYCIASCGFCPCFIVFHAPLEAWWYSCFFSFSCPASVAWITWSPVLSTSFHYLLTS